MLSLFLINNLFIQFTIMQNLSIIPVMTHSSRFNLGEFAEDATVLKESEEIKKVNHFIEANTEEVSISHLLNGCITPVFSKDNELTISHPVFIETIQDAANSFFSGEQIDQADIRVSHVVKGRIRSISLLINCWNQTKLSITKGVPSALIFLLFMKR